MAKKLLVPESILKSKEISSDAKLILNAILDEAKYAERGDIDVTALGNELGLRDEDIRQAVYRLQDRQLLRCCEGNKYVSPHEATGFLIKVELVLTPLKNETPTGQRSMGFDDVEAGFEGRDAQLVNDPRKTFRDTVLSESENTRYDLEILEIKQEEGDGTLCYRANVSAKDIGADESTRIHPVQGLEFPNIDELLDWWREAYKVKHDPLERAKGQEFDVLAWAADLPVSEVIRAEEEGEPDIHEVWVSEGALAQIADALEIDRQDVPFQGDPGDGLPCFFYIDYDGRRYVHASNTEREESDLPPVTIDSDPGDEQPEEAPAEEEPGLDAFEEDPRFTHELEDGSEVTVHIRATGRGWASVTLTGPVNDAESMVTSIRLREIGEDPEGWSLTFAEKIRREFVEATGR